MKVIPIKVLEEHINADRSSNHAGCLRRLF